MSRIWGATSRTGGESPKNCKRGAQGLRVQCPESRDVLARILGCSTSTGGMQCVGFRGSLARILGCSSSNGGTAESRIQGCSGQDFGVLCPGFRGATSRTGGESPRICCTVPKNCKRGAQGLGVQCPGSREVLARILGSSSSNGGTAESRIQGCSGQDFGVLCPGFWGAGPAQGECSV